MPRNAALPLLLALAWALLLLLASVTTVACHPTTESTWEPSAEVAASEPDMARNPRAASYGTCLRQPGDAREWASGRSQARYSFNSAWSRMGSGCDTITTVRNAIAGAAGSLTCYAAGYNYGLNEAVNNAYVMCRGRTKAQTSE